MTEEELRTCWEFVRGDMAGPDFERWLFVQVDLDKWLGEERHQQLQFADYRNLDELWTLRQELKSFLETSKQCECLSLRNLDVIRMGGDFYSEQVFAHFDPIMDYGQEKWWLYISHCRTCAQDWMIAQDDRIYDNFYLRRIPPSTRKTIEEGSQWPDEFLTYEQVLRLGRTTGEVWTFLNPRSPALIATAEDLRCERPDISFDEIAYLLAISVPDAARLLKPPRIIDRLRAWISRD